jgi:predicted kinase
LAEFCETGLRAGFNMIADATFLQRQQRERFVRLGESLGCEVSIIDCATPEEELRRRLIERSARGGDASDADTAVLDYQLAHHDPLTAQERARIY